MSSSNNNHVLAWVLSIAVVAGAVWYITANDSSIPSEASGTPNPVASVLQRVIDEAKMSPAPTPPPAPVGYIPCTADEQAKSACTRDYRPVCGVDGKTYGNRCSACAGGATSSARPGACPTPAPTTPPGYTKCSPAEKAATICTAIYAPVCGDNGQTYASRCNACAAGAVESTRNGACQ